MSYIFRMDEIKAQNIRCKTSHFPLSALWAVVVRNRPAKSRLFIRECTTSRCAAKRVPQGTTIIPDDPVTG